MTVLQSMLNSSCSILQWARSEDSSSAQHHLTHLLEMRLLQRSWTVEQQSLSYQESSCDYCNANQPVITLRACQALDRTLCEPPFSSMWPRRWQKSHPVTGPHLNCLQQEYADWDIRPPAIVPLLISSHGTFSIWALHRSYRDLQVWSQKSQRKGSSWYTVCALGLQLMVIVPEPNVTTSNDLFCQNQQSKPQTCFFCWSTVWLMN